MFSTLVAVLLTSTHLARVDAGSLPRFIGSMHTHPREKRLLIHSYRASDAEFYLMSVYHASAGYINSTLTNSTDGVYIETRQCGRTYELTVTAFNRYGSSQPQKLNVSSERTSPSVSGSQENNSVATVSWTNKCEARYDVKIIDQNSEERNATSVSSPYTFSMHRNMLYAVEVIAIYENGEQPSSLKYFSTGWAGDVKSMSYVSTFHSFRLTWPVADYADLYQINVSSSSDAVFHTSIKTVINKHDVHGVKSGRLYKCSIKAINKLGEGPIRTQQLYAASDIPLIRQVSVSRDGTTRIEWTKAKDNDNYNLYIEGITGRSYYSGQVTGSVYTWKANSVSVNAYAYVYTRDYYYNRNSNYFYFGNVASRPVITSVVQTGHSKLRVEATTVGNADRIKIDVYYYYTDLNGNPVLSSRSSTFRTTSPWLASTYSSSGMNYIYYVTVFVDNDGDGSYEASSDTFIYRGEPPPAVSSFSQSSTSSNSVKITWSIPDRYVERYWVVVTAVTTSEIVANTSTTGTYMNIYNLKYGRYYSATVTTENLVGLGPSRSITVKTAMGSASVSVIQEPPYMARISVNLAPDAVKHILFIDNNRTPEQKTISSVNNTVIHKLEGALSLKIKIVAFYETGNKSTTKSFYGKCETGSCAGNASCTLDEDYQPICFCKKYFRGNGRTGCFPFCHAQQVGDYNFTTVRAGQVAYSEENCTSSRSNASVLCEIQQYGSEFQTLFNFYHLSAIDCDFELRNITSKANAMTEYGAKILCQHFELTTSKVSLIKHEDAKVILDYFEKLAESSTRMSSQGLKQCLLTASHLASYIRTQGDREDAKKLLKTLPRLFRRLNVYQYNHKSRDFTWTSDNIFAQVTDVPARLARAGTEENYLIFSEFLSPGGTGRLEHPVEMIVPLASVASVYEQMSRETECGLSAIRIVFLAFRGSNFWSKKSSDWILFLEMGTRVRSGKMPATQKVLIKKYISNPDNSSKSTPLSDFYCGALDAKNFLWKRNACSPAHGETQDCQCNQLGYYEILKDGAFPPLASIDAFSHQMQSSDVAGCTVVVATMICTIFFILSQKKLRRQRDIQALLHVLFTSSISHIVYVSGISSTTPVAACVAVAWLLHFFILCSWTWISVFVYASYASVYVENAISTKIARVGTGLAYTVPFCVALANGVITLAVSMTSQDKLITGPYNACFVQGYSLYFAFIFPVAAEFPWIFHSCFYIFKLIKKDGEFQRPRLVLSAVWPFVTLLAWSSAVTAALTANDVAKWIFFIMNMIQAIILTIGNRYAWRETTKQPVGNVPRPLARTNAESGATNVYEEHSAHDDPAYENCSHGNEAVYENLTSHQTSF